MRRPPTTGAWAPWAPSAWAVPVVPKRTAAAMTSAAARPEGVDTRSIHPRSDPGGARPQCERLSGSPPAFMPPSSPSRDGLPGEFILGSGQQEDDHDRDLEPGQTEHQE